MFHDPFAQYEGRQCLCRQCLAKTLTDSIFLGSGPPGGPYHNAAWMVTLQEEFGTLPDLCRIQPLYDEVEGVEGVGVLYSALDQDARVYAEYIADNLPTKMRVIK